MNEHQNIDVDADIPSNAVSVLGDGAVEEFPVLKAFQQYIDAEQNKARKRMVSLCIFFGCLMTIVIVMFLFLLNGVSQRNQALNDKLFEYLVKDRDRQTASPVVVQPPTDNSAVYGLTAKLEEIQKKLADAEMAERERQDAAKRDAEKAIAAEAASRKALEKARIKEQIELERLRAELTAEREKAAREKEEKKKAEIEAYRRKYYPELYEKKKPVEVESEDESAEDEVDAEIESLVKGLEKDGAVNYFEEDEKETSYSIPVEVKGTKSKWRIPNY